MNGILQQARAEAISFCAALWKNDPRHKRTIEKFTKMAAEAEAEVQEQVSLASILISTIHSTMPLTQSPRADYDKIMSGGAL